jgi:hypothetical protein
MTSNKSVIVKTHYFPVICEEDLLSARNLEWFRLHGVASVFFLCVLKPQFPLYFSFLSCVLRRHSLSTGTRRRLVASCTLRTLYSRRIKFYILLTTP